MSWRNVIGMIVLAGACTTAGIGIGMFLPRPLKFGSEPISSINLNDLNGIDGPNFKALDNPPPRRLTPSRDLVDKLAGDFDADIKAKAESDFEVMTDAERERLLDTLNGYNVSTTAAFHDFLLRVGQEMRLSLFGAASFRTVLRDLGKQQTVEGSQKAEKVAAINSTLKQLDESSPVSANLLWYLKHGWEIKTSVGGFTDLNEREKFNALILQKDSRAAWCNLENINTEDASAATSCREMH